jgi:tetratricopeptide (TPR) repeat protein
VLGDQGNILNARGDLDGAMTLFKESESLCRDLGDKNGLFRALGSQATILKARGDLDGAMPLHKEEERLCRELGNKHGLGGSLNNQANILRARGDLDGAMALHKEAERLCRDLGNKLGLAQTLGNQANVLRARGDLDGTMALYKESERLWRELDNPEGLAIALANEASLLSGTPNRRGEARRLANEALAIVTRHGYQQLVAQFQRVRDSILSSDQENVIKPKKWRVTFMCESCLGTAVDFEAISVAIVGDSIVVNGKMFYKCPEGVIVDLKEVV